MKVMRRSNANYNSENNSTLRLEWNIQPWVGALVFGASEVIGEPELAFPAAGR